MKHASRIDTNLTSLLAELPPESVQLVEQFARFLREQTRLGHKITVTREKGKRQPYLYPTVSVPASTVDNWVGLLSEGYEGDALEDSEALYDAA